MSGARPIINELEGRSKAPDFPDFRVGDTVRVHVRIVEGDKERVQVFEGQRREKSLWRNDPTSLRMAIMMLGEPNVAVLVRAGGLPSRP